MVGWMEYIFYELIQLNLFIRDGEGGFQKQIAEIRFGFKRLGIIIERMEGAG